MAESSSQDQVEATTVPAAEHGLAWLTIAAGVVSLCVSVWVGLYAAGFVDSTAELKRGLSAGEITKSKAAASLQGLGSQLSSLWRYVVLAVALGILTLILDSSVGKGSAMKKLAGIGSTIAFCGIIIMVALVVVS